MSLSIQYKFPPEAYQVLLLLSLFLYVDQAAPNTLGARIRQAVGGPSVMDKIRRIAIGIHILEAAVMLLVNVRRGASFRVTCKWVLTTLIFGGPSWGTFSQVNHGVL